MLKFMKQMSPKNTCFRVQRPYCLSALTRLFLFSLPLYTGPRHRHFSFCRKAAVVKPLWNLKRKKRKKKKKKKEQTTFLTQNYVLTNFKKNKRLSRPKIMCLQTSGLSSICAFCQNVLRKLFMTNIFVMFIKTIFGTSSSPPLSSFWLLRI